MPFLSKAYSDAPKGAPLGKNREERLSVLRRGMGQISVVLMAKAGWVVSTRVYWTAIGVSQETITA